MQAVALSPTGCRKKAEHVLSCYHHTATHLPCQENGLRRRAADKAAEEHGAGEEQEGEEHLQPGIQRGANQREDEAEGRIRRHHHRHDEKGQREEQRGSNYFIHGLIALLDDFSLDFGQSNIIAALSLPPD